jgi:hypothetical protein
MSRLLVATREGVFTVGGAEPTLHPGRRVDQLVFSAGVTWTVVDGNTVARDGKVLADTSNATLRCVLPTDNEVLVGAAEARLYRLGASLALDEAFMTAAGREGWHTPWGGPPDVRSLAAGVDGTVYANVHVGGVLRRRRGEWEPTMDINADAHQVAAHPTDPTFVAAATARGLAVSRDGAETWAFHDEGLHATYCRAVAISEDSIYVTASRGPRGGMAAVYRQELTGGRLEKLSDGLPDWFEANIDTGCLVAQEDEVAFGEDNGTVWRSRDGGSTWSQAAERLPETLGVTLLP